MDNRNEKGQFVKNHGFSNKAWNWKGGMKVEINGYISLRAERHPKAISRGFYVYQHRLVMEKHLGRYLHEGEVVHHINNNPHDNRLENLQLFVSNAEHIRHHLQKYRKVSVLHEPVKIGEIVSKIDKGGQFRKYQIRRCVDCGKLFWAGFYGKAQRCISDSRKKRKCEKHKIKTRIIICSYCGKEREIKNCKKTKFCSIICYHKHQKESPREYSCGFVSGHKPYNYWLGKKRSIATIQKIKDTKRIRRENGIYR